MKIGIIGLGVIGTATKEGFEHIGHTVKTHDLKLGTKLEDVLDTEIIFLCLPTPSKQTGECDTSIIDNVIEQIDNKLYNGIIAIKSTVEPGFTIDVIKKYNNNNICFVPEFLHERKAKEDFINNHKLLAIGTNSKDVYKKIVEVHGNLPQNIVMLKPTEAELLKYYNNVFASLRVTFANVMYEICKKMSLNEVIDYTKIKNTYLKTGKTVDLYLDCNEDMRGYSGACLPKDTKALIQLMKKLKINYNLIKSIDKDNNKFKKTVFKGMRNET